MAKGFKTGGRKKGTPNKRTIEKELRSNGILPLDFMLDVMRDETKPIEIRTDMAKAAAPYVHAKRAPENKGGQTIPAVYYVHPNLESEDGCCPGCPGAHLKTDGKKM